LHHVPGDDLVAHSPDHLAEQVAGLVAHDVEQVVESLAVDQQLALLQKALAPRAGLLEGGGHHLLLGVREGELIALRQLPGHLLDLQDAAVLLTGVDAKNRHAGHDVVDQLVDEGTHWFSRMVFTDAEMQSRQSLTLSS
jgi:hypothetical protein